MKSIKKYSLLLLLVFTFTSIEAVSQNLPEQGNIGLRASFFGQSTIEAPYMLNENISIAPALSFNNVQDASSSFQIGIQPRFYMQTVGTLLPYVTGNLAVDVQKNKILDVTSTDILLGVGYGGEYFFDESFSISADANINLRTGDSATSLRTAALISASVYF